MIKRGKKKGQVTIFIIVAVVIIALVALFYAFYPQIKSVVSPGSTTPQSFLQGCFEEDMSDTLNKISLQGGALNPEFYYDYIGQKLSYLCYTNEYYKLCTVQEPMLKGEIEKELETNLASAANQCFDKLKQNYERLGYHVTLDAKTGKASILQQKVMMSFNSTLTLDKDGDTKRYSSFDVMINSNIYEFAEIATSIISFETTYGNSETTLYMDNYRELKVEKLTEDDGTKVYILTNRNTDEKFQFAIRSMAWKPGYSW